MSDSKKTLSLDDFVVKAKDAAISTNGFKYHPCCGSWTTRAASISRKTHRKTMNWREFTSPFCREKEGYDDKIKARLRELDSKIPIVMNEPCSNKQISPLPARSAFKQSSQRKTQSISPKPERLEPVEHQMDDQLTFRAIEPQLQIYSRCILLVPEAKNRPILQEALVHSLQWQPNPFSRKSDSSIEAKLGKRIEDLRTEFFNRLDHFEEVLQASQGRSNPKDDKQEVPGFLEQYVIQSNRSLSSITSKMSINELQGNMDQQFNHLRDHSRTKAKSYCGTEQEHNSRAKIQLLDTQKIATS